MKPSRSKKLAEKAEKALISSIEAYNRPDSPYREETFAILVLNAWELLLKAKLVYQARNNIHVLHVYEPRLLHNGNYSTRHYPKKNRTGNPYTLGLSQVISKLEGDYSVPIPRAVKLNIEALTEIRDNAVHYFNASVDLGKRVLEVGTASVKNFLLLAREWFGIDLSNYSLYLLPIGFVTAPGIVQGVQAGVDEKRLIKYLTDVSRSSQESPGDFHAALEIAISMKRVPNPDGLQVQITRNPDAPVIRLSEEDITKQYPWDYQELTIRCRERYVNFKLHNTFHQIRKNLNDDPRYTRVRLLDPSNPNGIKKTFHNPNILDEFDKVFTRK